MGCQETPNLLPNNPLFRLEDRSSLKGELVLPCLRRSGGAEASVATAPVDELDVRGQFALERASNRG
jgi:hypothetical protein